MKKKELNPLSNKKLMSDRKIVYQSKTENVCLSLRGINNVEEQVSRTKRCRISKML